MVTKWRKWWVIAAVVMGLAGVAKAAQPVIIWGQPSPTSSSQYVPATIDNNGLTSIQFSPSLSTYAFTSVSGTATLTGYFIDSTGAQVTALQTYSITSATDLTNLYDAANSITSATPLPSSFVGFKAALAGAALYVGNGATTTGTLTYSPSAGYPQVAIATYLTFGKV